MKTGLARSGSIDIAWRSLGEGPKTVLLHTGMNMHGGLWGTAFPTALARYAKVVWFDPRGTGDSTLDIDELSLDSMAKDALCVLDHVEVGTASVLGFSFGGGIAQTLASKHSARIERLLLLSSSLGTVDSIPADPAAITVLGPRWEDEQHVRRGLRVIIGPSYPSRDPEGFELLVKAHLDRPVSAPVLALQRATAEHPRRALATRIRCPTLIVHGESDRIVPVENARLSASAIAGSRVVTLPSVGHIPYWEATQKLVEITKGWLADEPQGVSPSE